MRGTRVRTPPTYRTRSNAALGAISRPSLRSIPDTHCGQVSAPPKCTHQHSAAEGRRHNMSKETSQRANLYFLLISRRSSLRPLTRQWSNSPSIQTSPLATIANVKVRPLQLCLDQDRYDGLIGNKRCGLINYTFNIQIMSL